jgi:hypothetical protein
MHVRLVFGRKPELTDFLILAHKVRACDPKGETSGWLSLDPYNPEIFRIDPDVAHEHVPVRAPWNRLDHITVIRA